MLARMSVYRLVTRRNISATLEHVRKNAPPTHSVLHHNLIPIRQIIEEQPYRVTPFLHTIVAFS